MGLDMYLTERMSEKEEEASLLAYWRKANAIHKFLSDKIIEEHGLEIEEIENCQNYLISYQALSDLIDTCQRVLQHKELASQELPTYQGFFYGSYEYDDWYFEIIEETIQQIQPILNQYNPEDMFVYSVWW